LELTGRRAPRTGLEAKFSVYHGCAAGLLFGRAGEAEFGDAVVARAELAALRDRIIATADERIGEAQADVTITCRDGRRFHAFIAHAIGSLERPMTDADLKRKFRALADPVLGPTRAAVLCAALGTVAACDDLAALTALARP
jgi:2-methylcitrate dehydratase PrpD